MEEEPDKSLEKESEKCEEKREELKRLWEALGDCV
jgi:hypothetical protein